MSGWTSERKRRYRESYAKAESNVASARLLLLAAGRNIKDADFYNGCSIEFHGELRSYALLLKRIERELMFHRMGMFPDGPEHGILQMNLAPDTKDG